MQIRHGIAVSLQWLCLHGLLTSVKHDRGPCADFTVSASMMQTSGDLRRMGKFYPKAGVRSVKRIKSIHLSN
jgi:hypothetical protein